MADTNASGYEVDELSVNDIDLSETSCRVNVAFSAKGDTDDDRMFTGDTVSGTPVACIGVAQVEFKDVVASVAYENEEEEDDDGEDDDSTEGSDEA